MKLLGHLLASLLALAVGLVIVVTTFGLTIGQAGFWTSAAAKSGLYAGLAATTPGVSADQVRAAVEPLIPQLIAHYTSDGPVPVLNLASFLPQEAVTALPGVEIPRVPLVSGPADAALMNTVRYARIAKVVAAGVAVGLVVLILAVMGARRWSTLTQAAIWVTVTCAVSALLMFVLPNLAGLILANGAAELASFQPVLTRFFGAIGAQIGQILLVVAAGSLVATAVLAVIGRFMALRRKFAPKPVPPQPPAAT